MKMSNSHSFTSRFVFQKHGVNAENRTPLNRAAKDAQNAQARTSNTHAPL